MSHFDADLPLGSFSWEQMQRFRLLEIMLYWEGRLNTHYLCNAFYISRQQASRDINRYITDVSPAGLEYDRKAKTYKPTDRFVPRFSKCTVDDYLRSLHATPQPDGPQRHNPVLPAIDFHQGHIATLEVPVRHIDPLVVRSLVEAARHQLRVDVDYVSLGSGEQVGRNIVPHTLVFDGIRWHVRAWCEKKRRYLDFVMSRFRGVPDLLDASQQGIDADSEWHCKLTAEVVPNPFLTSDQQKIVAADYGMTDGRLAVTQRLPLMHYVLDRLQVNYAGSHEKQPLQSPLVLANREALTAQGCDFRLPHREQ